MEENGNWHEAMVVLLDWQAEKDLCQVATHGIMVDLKVYYHSSMDKIEDAIVVSIESMVEN